ncbi:uncharacterized protein LOC132548632 [Ylistrum balloti]|nr:uncharacterized protein LOC132548632 [Ylistrum balloti]
MCLSHSNVSCMTHSDVRVYLIQTFPLTHSDSCITHSDVCVYLIQTSPL